MKTIMSHFKLSFFEKKEKKELTSSLDNCNKLRATEKYKHSLKSYIYSYVKSHREKMN